MSFSVVIVNPFGSRVRDPRRRAALVQAVGDALRTRDGSPPRVVETASQAETRPVVDAAVRDGAAAVIGIGGDGTLREIAASLQGTGVPLGIVPGGTGNLLAGILGVPGSPEAAVLALQDARPRTIDLGEATLRRTDEASDQRRAVDQPGASDQPGGAEPWNAAEATEERGAVDQPGGAEQRGGAEQPGAAEATGDRATFAIGCGAGFDARVMATTPSHLKRRFGKGAYFAQAVRLALEIEAVPFHITVDGSVIETDASIALVTNMGELIPGLVGPRLPIIPDDGLLDLIVVGARGPLHGIKGLIDQLYRTRLGGSSGSDSLRVRGRQIEIAADRPEPLQVDGDHVGWGSLSARVLPGALDVLVPATSA